MSLYSETKSSGETFRFVHREIQEWWSSVFYVYWLESNKLKVLRVFFCSVSLTGRFFVRKSKYSIATCVSQYLGSILTKVCAVAAKTYCNLLMHHDVVPGDDALIAHMMMVVISTVSPAYLRYVNNGWNDWNEVGTLLFWNFLLCFFFFFSVRCIHLHSTRPQTETCHTRTLATCLLWTQFTSAQSPGLDMKDLREGCGVIADTVGSVSTPF